MASKMLRPFPMPTIVLALGVSACTVVPGQPGGRYAYVARTAYPPPLAQFQVAQPPPPPLPAPQPPTVVQPSAPPARETDANTNRLAGAAVALKCSFVAHIVRDDADAHDRLYNACIQKEASKLKLAMEIGRRIQTRAVEQEYGVKLH